MKETRKIGGVVIMHPGQNNYGTSLQGFATVKFIQSNGYNLRIIRYQKKRLLKEKMRIGPLLIKSGLLRFQKTDFKNKITTLIYRNFAKNNAIRTNIVNQFKSKYFDSISDYYIGYENLHEGSKSYDVVFVGSDQVWGPLSLYAKFYNLLFVDSTIPTFSYASSFGISEILPWQIEGTKEFLNKLDIIGVREEQGKEIVNSFFPNKATVVLDPTMLLTKDEWNIFLEERKLKVEGKYILCYVLGNQKKIREQILKLKRETGLKVVFMRHIDEYRKSDDSFGDECPYDVDPLDFINLIKHAEYIITDSFHGTVFSIIFNAKFITFYRNNPREKKSTHSRIDNILSLFKLENRLFKDDIFKQAVQSIDYQQTNEILDQLREHSKAFFIKGLNLKK